MSIPVTHVGPGRRTKWLASLVAADAILLLFPPIHWVAGSHGAGASIGYFVGSSLAVMGSLFVMVRLDDDKTGDQQ